MEYISIGNTVGLQWAVEYYGGSPFPVEDSAVRLFMVTSRGRSEITDFSTAGNVVTWEFDTTDQYAGSYSFIMVLSDGDKLNSRLVWDHALRLSSYSASSSNGMVLTHTSTLDSLSTAVAQYSKLNTEYVSEAIVSVGTLGHEVSEMSGKVDALDGISETVDGLETRVTALEDTDFDGDSTSDATDYPEINLG